MFDNRDLEGVSRIILKDLLTDVEYVEIAGHGFTCGCGEGPIRLWLDGPCMFVRDVEAKRTVKINLTAFTRKMSHQMHVGSGRSIRQIAHYYLHHATQATHRGN